ENKWRRFLYMTLTLSPALVLDTGDDAMLVNHYTHLKTLTLDVPASRIVIWDLCFDPDLQTAQIKIINKFNPITGFQSPTYILKEWVTDTPFVISPRITFEVTVCAGFG
ncbi:hypothetical protein HID58_065917, partial [Brassica napus]